MANPDLWELIHIVNRQRLSGLRTEDVIQHLSSVIAEDHKHWFAWRSGMADWLCVKQLREFAAELAPPPPEMPAPPPAYQEAAPAASNAATAAVSQDDAPTESFESRHSDKEVADVPKKGSERRKSTRYNVRTKVVIVFNGQAFRSYSKDISVGGLLLANSIPWELRNKKCSVFISNPDGSQALEFVGKVLSDSKNPFRVEFANPSEAFLKTLTQWLESLKASNSITAA
jgi:hypothetical protein